MPTRIVLNTTAVPSQLSPRRDVGYPHLHFPAQANGHFRRKDVVEPGGDDDSLSILPSHNDGQDENIATFQDAQETGHGATGLRNRTAGRPNSATAPSPMRSSRTRSTVGFRSSILREMSVRQDSPNQMMPNHGIDDRHTTVRISSGDIRASPRFLGYLFCTISGSVLLVSVVQFYLTETSSLIIQPLDEVPSRLLIEGQNTTEPIVDDKFYVTVSGDLIYRWKLWGAIYTSASIVGICLIVMVVHYDTVIAPRLWMAVFRDGSLAERNLIFFLTICWMAGLHICTSSLSVGEVQANVYFTSWISFGSIALTYGVWRESAGLPTLMDIMNQHHRETTYNWIWIMIFSTVFAGAATDIYVNREELEFRYQGELLDLRRKNWITVLSVLWADVLVSGLAILFNEWFLESKPLPCSWKRKAGTYRCVFGWRQLEGIVMALGVAAKFWVIYEYTGVDGVINGLSNGYFGIWGTFFNSVFALGTWLKENKNTEYVILEPNNDDDQS